jgi:hypothetical protein
MKTAKVLGLDVPWQLQQLADAGNRAAPFAALHESGCDVVDGARSQQRSALG